MELSGTLRFIDVQGKDAKIILQNCNISEETELQNLVFADNVNGNLSITIHNTSVTSRSEVVYIKANSSKHIFLEIKDSYVSSRSYVVELSEATTYKETRLFVVNILNSVMYGSGYGIFSLSGCSSNFYGTIKESKFYGTYYQDIANFNFPSMNIDISENIFGDSRHTLYFDFCNQQRDSSDTYSKVIYISKNVFNSSISGKDIWIDRRYTDEKSHSVYIRGNIFGHNSIVTRQRLYAYRYDYSWRYALRERHSLIVDSNIFANSTDVAVYVDDMYKSIIFSNNTFVNNSRCIHITNPLPLIEINITKNTFINNSLSDGVILLDKVIGNNTNIIDNIFYNNTYTSIAFTSPNTTIIYNFFENGKDVYNLKVISEEYPDKLVNASLNFWGTTDAKEISKTIYDKDYADALFDIEFRPYLGSRNKSDIQNETISFVSKDSEIGGIVNGEVTLKYDKSPYLVITNVDVGTTDILNIEPGVVLMVKPGVGLKVYGL